MIATAPATAPVPAQAPGADVPGSALDAATAATADPGRPARTGGSPRGKAADEQPDGRAPRDARAGRDDSFARLLEPQATPDTDLPAPPATREASAPATAALPDQLLGLFAVLAPEAATPASSATFAQPAMQAQPALAAGAAQAGTATLQRAVAAALLPADAQAAPAQARVAANAVHTPAVTAASPGHANAIDARGHAPAAALALPALAAATAGHATASDDVARLAADAGGNAARDGLQTEALAATQPQPLQPPASASATRAPVSPHAPLPQPADPRAGYGDDFGNGVLWMTEKALGHARLRVNPEHLGPIDVRLQLDGARVHAEFSSAQPDVRQALEASLPRLRDMLGQHGLELAQADVGQRHRQDAPAPRHPGAEGGNAETDREGLAPTGLPRLRVARGLLDEYA